MGVKTLIVSNAAGGINPKYNYGDLMIIKDHIFLPGLAGFSPLVGLDDARFGPRFISVHDAYDRSLRLVIKDDAILNFVESDAIFHILFLSAETPTPL